MSVDVSSLSPSAPSKTNMPMQGAPMGLLADAQHNPVDIAAFRNSPQGKELTTWGLDQYRQCKAARKAEELQWKKNLAMFNGKQYLQVIREGQFKGQLIERPRTRDDRITVNKSETIVRTEISKCISQKPSVSVLPSSSDDQDLFAAMAGEQVWMSHSERHDFQEVLTNAIFWTSITGNGFIKTFWDESCIDTDAQVHGDVVYDAVSPFNFFVPDVREVNLEAQPFVINVYPKPVSWLNMFYANELKGVSLNPKASAASELLEPAYLNMAQSGKPEPDSCLVYEFWVKPGAYKGLPNGGYFVIVDKTLVAYDDQGIPYQHGEFPFAHIGHIITGKFYRRSTLDSTNDLNREYNQWRTHLVTARKRMGHPQLTAQKGAVSATRWSNETGLLIEYRPGFQAPSPLPIASLPPYIIQEGQTITTDIEDLSGQHQVSKGSAPSGVTAATAISYLQERDDAYLTPTFQSIERACQKVARHVLSLAVQFWDAPRLVKVAGDDDQFDVMQLQGSDIQNGTDVRVEAGSSLPTSKAAKQQFIVDLMNMGAVPMDKGLELLEIGGSAKLIDQLKADKRQAQRENVKLKGISDQEIAMYQAQWQQRAAANDPGTIDQATGQPMEPPTIVPVNSWDNHQVHIETHNLFRKSQSFQFLSPAVQAEFEKHVQMHTQMNQQQQLQGMLAALPSDGSVPGVSGLVDPSTGKASGQLTDGSGQGIPSAPQGPSDMQFGTQEQGGTTNGIGG